MNLKLYSKLCTTFIKCDLITFSEKFITQRYAEPLRTGVLIKNSWFEMFQKCYQTKPPWIKIRCLKKKKIFIFKNSAWNHGISKRNDPGEGCFYIIIVLHRENCWQMGYFSTKCTEYYIIKKWKQIEFHSSCVVGNLKRINSNLVWIKLPFSRH